MKLKKILIIITATFFTALFLTIFTYLVIGLYVEDKYKKLSPNYNMEEAIGVVCSDPLIFKSTIVINYKDSLNHLGKLRCGNDFVENKKMNDMITSISFITFNSFFYSRNFGIIYKDHTGDFAASRTASNSITEL